MRRGPPPRRERRREAVKESLGERGFARFYAPLAVTSLLLTGTDPILTAALGRTQDPTIALAGYAVAFAVCGVLYAPLLVVQQVAASRLLQASGGFAPVIRFAYATGVVLSGIGAAIAFTPLGEFVFGWMINASPPVEAEAMSAMRILWVAPFLTAVRAAHQGRLVAGHRTGPIAGATAGRTAVLAAVAFGASFIAGGATLGAIAFTAGLGVEMLVVLFASTPDLRLRGDGPQGDIAGFAAPLMVNVVLWWATPLLINAVLARTQNPDPALAAFAVVQALAWFIAAPVGQMQHAGIALVSCWNTHRRVYVRGLWLALALGALIALCAIPPAATWLFGTLFALEPELLALATAALPFAVAYPLLYGTRQYLQGLFVRSERSVTVGMGAVIRIGSIFLLSLVLASRLGAQGAVLGVVLNVLGLAVEGVFLAWMSRGMLMPELRRAARVVAQLPD